MERAQTFLSRLVLGPLAVAPVAVRKRMLATIPTTWPSLLMYCATLILICACAVVIDGGAWTWVWLTGSLLLVSWRVLHQLITSRSDRKPPLLSIMASSGLIMICFGIGCALCIASRDATLAAMATAGTMGVVAGLGTRWAALPRAGISIMALTVLGPVVVTAAQGGMNLIAGLAMVFTVLSIASFAIQNHKYMLAAVTADENSWRLARTDHLTGLANRVELMQQLHDRCARLHGVPERRGPAFALLYIDLDGFKSVNDSHGHSTGDELLQRVAGCLHTTCGPDATVARIGGDEFVILVEDADELTARSLSDEIIHAVARTHRMRGDVQVQVGCSIGVALAPAQGQDPEVLLARADAALYEVKHQGKGHSGVWRALGAN